MKIIAITSGKGGVGKTNISANLAIGLSNLGKRVVVLDGDIGLANLDVVLGCRADCTLQDVVTGNKSLAEIIQKGPANIRYIAGGSGLDSIFTLESAQAERLTSDLIGLADTTDVLLLDTGAGLDSNVLTFLSAAHQILIVVTPDPASITDGYATAKAIAGTNPHASIDLLLNQVGDEHEARDIYNHISGVAKRFINLSIGFGGYVREDAGAVQYIRKRVPFLIGDPKLPAAIDIARIAATHCGYAPEPEAFDLRARIRALFPFARRTA